MIWTSLPLNPKQRREETLLLHSSDAAAANPSTPDTWAEHFLLSLMQACNHMVARVSCVITCTLRCFGALDEGGKAFSVEAHAVYSLGRLIRNKILSVTLYV